MIYHYVALYISIYHSISLNIYICFFMFVLLLHLGNNDAVEPIINRFQHYHKLVVQIISNGSNW